MKIVDMRNYDERYYERRLIKAVEGIGGVCWKFVSPGHGGVPDRIILLPGGAVLFVEMKAPGKSERPLQVAVQARMRKLGVTVFSAVNSTEKIDAVIAECRRRIFTEFPENEGGESG